MKKMILLATASMLTTTAFATTITCVGGEVGITQGSVKVLELEALKKAPMDGIILEKDGVKFLLSISNIYSPEKDGSETIISKDAMVLSRIRDNKNLSSIISDGKNLILFDAEKNVSIMCRKD